MQINRNGINYMSQVLWNQRMQHIPCIRIINQRNDWYDEIKELRPLFVSEHIVTQCVDKSHPLLYFLGVVYQIIYFPQLNKDTLLFKPIQIFQYYHVISGYAKEIDNLIDVLIQYRFLSFVCYLYTCRINC